MIGVMILEQFRKNVIAEMALEAETKRVSRVHSYSTSAAGLDLSIRSVELNPVDDQTGILY